MSKSARILSVFLMLCMLFSTMIACSKDDIEDASDDAEYIADDEASKDASGAPTPIMDDFGGYQFKVLTRGSGMYKSDDITGDMTGNVLSLATYQRNAALESKYNFTIVESKEKDWNSVATKLGQAGQYQYDMWSFKMADMPSHGQEGHIYNLNEVAGINLDASYYDQTTRESVSFANYLFFITGDMLYMDDLAISCVLYHPTLWKDLKCSEVYDKDIYTLVKDGEWTLEAFKTIAALAPKDINGDGKYDDENDRWGCGYANGDIFTLSVALGNHVVEKDANDVFYLNDGEKIISDLQNIFAFFNSPSCIKDGTYTTGLHLFQILQLANGTGPNSPIRKAGIEYGIVPPPKANATDGWYRSYVSAYTANCIAIPSTLKGADLDKAANIIELVSYESQSTTVPKLSEYLFGNVSKHASDVEMIEILKETRTYENAYIWSTGSIYSTLIDLNLAGGEGIKSAFETSKQAVEDSVARKLQRLQQLG